MPADHNLFCCRLPLAGFEAWFVLLLSRLLPFTFVPPILELHFSHKLQLELQLSSYAYFVVQLINPQPNLIIATALAELLSFVGELNARDILHPDSVQLVPN
jgi:hypothetical protein